MGRVRVNCFAISLDGFGAGPHQDLQNPLGVGGKDLHCWSFATRTFQRTVMKSDRGETGVDDGFMRRGFEGVGAWILGRNMFGPVRGPWLDEEWRGWWGDNPPYHVPVYVLTHHARPTLEMEGNTTFHFVTGGIHEALAAAKRSAGDADVRIGGGAQTIRQYLQAGAIDEMHLAITPALLGSGEPLLHGLDLRGLGYTCTEHVPSSAVTHVVLTKR